jgi:hypothetical protein
LKIDRKFQLSDAIVLVAATAVDFTIAWPYYETMNLLNGKPAIPSAGQFSGWIRSVFGCLMLAAPVVMAWTLALLALRLRRPRDRWRSLVRQPGLVAGLMAVVVLLGRLIGFATMYVRVSKAPRRASSQGAVAH